MKITVKFAHLILLALTKESLLCLIFTLCSLQGNEVKKIIFHDDLHDYYTSNPDDSFSELIPLFQLGKLTLPFNSDEKEMVRQLLQKLNIPISSQTLVFSNTSLQLSKIGPNSPRAIYFSDDLYLGYVPNGQIEVIGIDPQRGAIPYIFSLPKEKGQQFPPISRSRKCMRCHASEKTDFIPGLLLGSVIPMHGGGTLDVLNHGKPSHNTPYSSRFGGWYLNSPKLPFSNWANAIGKIVNHEKIEKTQLHNQNWAKKYPTGNSDPISIMVLEHQIGFTNLCIKLQYLSRQELNRNSNLSDEFINQSADKLLEYCLFKNEPKLPNAMKKGESEFAKVFETVGQNKSATESLRELQLKERLFKHRCSYMINSKLFGAIHTLIRKKFFSKLALILSNHNQKNQSYKYLTKVECEALDRILSLTNEMYRVQKKGV